MMRVLVFMRINREGEFTVPLKLNAWPSFSWRMACGVVFLLFRLTLTRVPSLGCCNSDDKRPNHYLQSAIHHASIIVVYSSSSSTSYPDMATTTSRRLIFSCIPLYSPRPRRSTTDTLCAGAATCKAPSLTEMSSLLTMQP